MVNANMNTCDICLKAFKRRDNMLRHKKNKHRREVETDMSDSELSDQETTDSEAENGMSEADEASDTERHSEQYDPWESVVHKAFLKCQDQFEEAVTKLLQKRNIDQTEARKEVYHDMRSTYRKAISSVFINRIVWFQAMRKHPVYKAIKKTAANFVDLDDYSPEEAWKSAIGQRKYLFDTILAEYYPPEVEEDLSDDEEPLAKRAKV